MSDHGDYREPKAGEWVLVIERDGDIAACLKVVRVDDMDGADIVVLSDGSPWGAETGQPLRRGWAGHYLWPIDKTDDCVVVADMLYEASPDASGAAYSVLLADKRAREKKA